MKKIIITKDCLCEHYLHEKTNYPRPGLVEKKFSEGETFQIYSEWSNFYGTYYRVDIDGNLHDILKSNARKVL